MVDGQAHNLDGGSSNLPSAFVGALRADVVIEGISRPGALSACEILGTLGVFARKTDTQATL